MNTFGPLRSGLVFAADLPTLDENLAVLDAVGDLVDVVKVNAPLLYREGLGVIAMLRGRGLPVFADIKVADVPTTNSALIRAVRDAGAQAVMVHGMVGPDGIEDAVKTAGDDVGVIVQLELTHPGGILYTQPIALDIAGMATMFDVMGFQAPGNRPDRVSEIRAVVGPDPILVCCGIGAQGGDFRAAITAGGTYGIVGRSIYQDPDPRRAAETTLGLA